MRIAIVAHDAGGSDVISSWIKHHLDSNSFQYFLGGPAQSIFKRRLGVEAFHPLEEIETQVLRERPELAITSVSWGTMRERESWLFFRENEIPSVCYMDGWSTFTNTFTLEGKDCYPDELWLTNEDAWENALRVGIPEKILKRKRNYFIEDILSKVAEYSKEQTSDQRNHILYLCENISTAEASNITAFRPKRGYTEVEALDYFFMKVRDGSFDAQSLFRIRPHPSEHPEKYYPVVQKYSQYFQIEFSFPGTPLEKDLGWASEVVGCESVALMIATDCTPRVYSCIPPYAKIFCRLPSRKIIHIREGASADRSSGR